MGGDVKAYGRSLDAQRHLPTLSCRLDCPMPWAPSTTACSRRLWCRRGSRDWRCGTARRMLRPASSVRRASRRALRPRHYLTFATSSGVGRSRLRDRWDRGLLGLHAGGLDISCVHLRGRESVGWRMECYWKSRASIHPGGCPWSLWGGIGGRIAPWLRRCT